MTTITQAQADELAAEIQRHEPGAVEIHMPEGMRGEDVSATLQSVLPKAWWEVKIWRNLRLIGNMPCLMAAGTHLRNSRY